MKQRVHLAQFIQKQRAAISARGRPFLVVHSAGERAFDVAENHAFQQILRDGAAIQRHEAFGFARTELVQRFGGQFLSGAGLAGDEYTGRTLGSRLNGPINRLHRHRAADEVNEFRTFDCFAQGFHLAPEIRCAQGVFDRRCQPAGCKRFHQIIESATAHRTDGRG